MKKDREKIPPDLSNAVLYKAAKTCCVCRIPRAPVEIHHIDQDPSNNVESNLIAICRKCHDEAHTKRALSQNLTPTRLLDFKGKWEHEISTRAAQAMLPSGNLSQAIWTYVNHQRLPDVMAALGVKFEPDILRNLVARGTTDPLGIPIFQKPSQSSFLTTIYDRFEWDESRRLHALYTRAVDDVILAAHPFELGAIWTKSEIKSLVKPGSLCFCMRGFRFQRGEEISGEEDRIVYAKAKNIEIRLTANTRHMYGSSALYDSFSGNRFAAILMLVRDVATDGANLVIRATPLAMGAGFVHFAYHTPYSLRYGWAKGTDKAAIKRTGKVPTTQF
jgi:hypothetical protein